MVKKTKAERWAKHRIRMQSKKAQRKRHAQGAFEKLSRSQVHMARRNLGLRFSRYMPHQDTAEAQRRRNQAQAAFARKAAK